MPRLDAIAARLHARAEHPASPLDADEARRRLVRCNGPIDAALALEACVGGLRLDGWEIGLDTHRTHPPRDAYDTWLDRSLQRELVQIAFGGPHRATYWLDDAGWVHEIAPLDRLRPVAENVESFLEAIVEDGRRFVAHTGIVAVAPLLEEDADAFLGSVAGCPIAGRIVRWDERARRFLEEERWIADHAPGATVVSSRTLADLARPLADLLAVEPGLTLVFVDAAPRLAREVKLTEIWATAPYRIPWTDVLGLCAIGLDPGGAPAIAAHVEP